MSVHTVNPGVGDVVDAIVGGARLFQGVDPAAVATVTRRLQPVRFSPRHTVYAEVEVGDRLYIVVRARSSSVVAHPGVVPSVRASDPRSPGY